MIVFFYGLFMDEDLLKQRGLNPSDYATAFAVVAKRLEFPEEYVEEIETWSADTRNRN